MEQSIVENEKFDLFIAYYGNKLTGNENDARELYEYIRDEEIYPGRKIRPYFHPVTNPYGRFEDTPAIVARTPMFLLVVDKNIRMNEYGQLLKRREDGSLSNLFEEVRTFHDSVMYKSPGGDSAAKLFITDDFDFKEAEKLHPMFSGRVALKAKEEVVEWFAYFYHNTYVSRYYNHCKHMAQNNKSAFVKGDWVKEAEYIWKFSLHEGLGRTLMIYYIMKAERGDRIAARRLREIYEQFSKSSKLEASTQTVLSKIKARFL